ncbi:hypothetical protein ACFFV7_36125 [Nonomuraea spiralis]|uniref:Uncharacterized protein n=1 Tax=Nonomuraea spiralis TaxID=46182 RepID=A0ABV5ISG4_9ACTN|nr:hypothetical protein [Nonomuraea spiralis]GGT11611.1 hypothetical protein GCM10010176_065390 [Nonomuraea spiralis]
MDLLPGGYWDAGGRLHRDFELTALTGHEEELLSRPGQSARLVTEVLSRCVRRLGGLGPVTPAIARELLVADRHYLLLQLRRGTFGDLVRADLVCPWPDCGRRVSLTFSLDQVPVEEAREQAATYTLWLGGTEVTFRLPNGGDQEELAELLAHDEAEATTRLLARCLLRLGTDGPPDRARVSALPAADRAAIEARMAELAPRVEQTMQAECAECRRTFLAPFDVQRFFLGDLRIEGEQLYHEVHYLAYHYHWSEREIMEMTRERRRTYIDVLSETIEVLNGGA